MAPPMDPPVDLGGSGDQCLTTDDCLEGFTCVQPVCVLEGDLRFTLTLPSANGKMLWHDGLHCCVQRVSRN